MRPRRAVMGMLVLLVSSAAAPGCSRNKSSLLLERTARGPLDEEGAIAHQDGWTLEPKTLTTEQKGVSMTVTYAPPSFLQGFFANKKIFGEYAGMNPYFSEQMIFYVTIANRSGKKIQVDPGSFVLVDDLGNQYHNLSVDYTTALAESKAPVSTMTRGVLDEAHPGYFGVGVPVGKLLRKSQRRFALLQISSLQAGYLYDGVTYDGLVTFWSPHAQAKQLRLFGTVKADFQPNDAPQAAFEFNFQFASSR